MMTDTDQLDGAYLATRRAFGWEKRDILAAQIFDREQEFRLQAKGEPTNLFQNGARLGLQIARDIVTGENL